jgi:S1-C subfamily serine protease
MASRPFTRLPWGGEIGGLTRRESFALAFAMNARGSTEVIVATIGLSMGALTQNLFTMIVAMAVATTMAMPPMLRWGLSRVPMGAEDRKRLEREEIEAKGFVSNLERLLLAVDDSPNFCLAARRSDRRGPRPATNGNEGDLRRRTFATGESRLVTSPSRKTACGPGVAGNGIMKLKCVILLAKWNEFRTAIVKGQHSKSGSGLMWPATGEVGRMSGLKISAKQSCYLTVISILSAVLSGALSGPIIHSAFSSLEPATDAQFRKNVQFHKNVKTLSGSATLADVVVAVKPAVTNVTAWYTEPASHPTTRIRESRHERAQRDLSAAAVSPKIVSSQGAGFFISADGYLVTNAHVLQGSTDIEVVTDDGLTYTPRFVGADPTVDLALLKVDDGRDDFPFVKFADKSPRVGEAVFAIGNPFGFSGTVTAGIVSALGRNLDDGVHAGLVQLDAAINLGNSGGPSFDMKGEVIGVNTAIYSPSGGSAGIAFAIPSETVKLVAEDLKRDSSVSGAPQLTLLLSTAKRFTDAGAGAK